jgi:hypothetical protein
MSDPRDREPEVDQGLRQLLQTHRVMPPEGYADSLWAALEPQLQQPPLWVRTVSHLRRPFPAIAAGILLLVLTPALWPQLQQQYPKAEAPTLQDTVAPATPEGFTIGSNQRSETLARTPLRLGAAPPRALEEAQIPSEDSLAAKEEYKAKSLAPAPSTQNLSGTSPAEITQEVDMQLEVKHLAERMQAILKLTEQAGGFAREARLEQAPQGEPRAELQLKIPRARFQSTLTAIQALGTLRQLHISGEDLWEPLTQNRLAQSQLVAKLAQTKDPEAQRALQQEIDQRKLDAQRHERALAMGHVRLILTAQPQGQWAGVTLIPPQIEQRLAQALRQTLEMAVTVVAVLPPLLLWCLCATAVWKVLAWVLVTKLGLMQLHTFGWLFLSAIVFFPLYLSRGREWMAMVTFVVLSLIMQGARQGWGWWQKRSQSPTQEQDRSQRD